MRLWHIYHKIIEREPITVRMKIAQTIFFTVLCVWLGVSWNWQSKVAFLKVSLPISFKWSRIIPEGFLHPTARVNLYDQFFGFLSDVRKLTGENLKSRFWENHTSLEANLLAFSTTFCTTFLVSWHLSQFFNEDDLLNENELENISIWVIFKKKCLKIKFVSCDTPQKVKLHLVYFLGVSNYKK